jgi:hypothetical protein
LDFSGLLGMYKYENEILPVFMHENEAWPLTLREEHIGKIFEGRVLRIFVFKRGEATGGWRDLQNREFLNLCSSPDITRMIMSKMMRRTEHYARVRRQIDIGYW